MNSIHAVLLGIVEGITEFLPISSTFHLLWTSNLLGIEQTDFVKLFLVVIQGGAILSVVFLYWRDLLFNRDMMMKIIASFIPTAIIGFALYKVIKGVFFESMMFTTSVFIAIGVVFLIVEYLVDKKKIILEKPMKKLGWKDAILVGLFQSLAVVPGVSRSGSVIIGMMFLKYKREDSAKYSFLVSVPTILAASVLDLYQMKEVLMSNADAMMFLVVGTVVSFISAFIGVKWLIGYLQRNSLRLFGWYRIILGIILLLLAGR
jgi:undecaprenyl-diphosphatase